MRFRLLKKHFKNDAGTSVKLKCTASVAGYMISNEAQLVIYNLDHIEKRRQEQLLLQQQHHQQMMSSSASSSGLISFLYKNSSSWFILTKLTGLCFFMILYFSHWEILFSPRVSSSSTFLRLNMERSHEESVIAGGGGDQTWDLILPSPYLKDDEKGGWRAKVLKIIVVTVMSWGGESCLRVKQVSLDSHLR